MGNFTIRSITELKNAKIGDVVNESDYALVTNDNKFVQFEYTGDDDRKAEPYTITPGIWSIQKSIGGLVLQETKFVVDKLLETHTITKTIEGKIDTFFSRFDIYHKRNRLPIRKMLLYGTAGCHAKDTGILMYDGSVKMVQDVVIGDQLMGPDSLPRNALSLARGREEMIKVSPTKGDSFVVNKNHIFHFEMSGLAYKGEKFNSTIHGLDSLTSSKREKVKLKRSSVNFLKKEVSIPPYILGLWIGDGHSRGTSITTMDIEVKNEWLDYAKFMNMDVRYHQQEDNKAVTISLSSKEKTKGKNIFLNHLIKYNLQDNKHIPSDYLYNSRENRLQLLAGLLDTDGYYHDGHFEISAKSNEVADGIIYLARSLGFAAYNNPAEKYCQTGGGGIYNRITISGDLELIPNRVERRKASPRQQIKNVLRTGFKYELLPEDNYYGFALDRDHLYLTSDFTIHHNTGKTSSIIAAIDKYTNDKKTATLVWHTDKYEAHQVKDFIMSFEYKDIEKLILIMEDIGGVERDEGIRPSESSLLSLLDNKEETFKIPTLIIATTNHPETLLGNLTNRPGRFSDKIEVGLPTADERISLMRFFYEKELAPSTIELLKSTKSEQFTPDHIKHIIENAELYDKPIDEAIIDMYNETQLFNKAFSKKSSVRSAFYDE